MKRKIRLTESDLHRVIKECVYNILNEGKVVNNKPYFKDRHDEYVKPGERAGYYTRDVYWQRKGFDGAEDAFNAARNINDDRLTIEDFERGQDEFDEMVEKHQKRAKTKYYCTFDETGHSTPNKPIYTRDADIERFEIHNKNKAHQRRINNDITHNFTDHGMYDPPFKHSNYYDLYDEE